MSAGLKTRGLADQLVAAGLIPPSRVELMRAVTPDVAPPPAPKLPANARTEPPPAKLARPVKRAGRAKSGRMSGLRRKDLCAHLRAIGCAPARWKGSHEIWRTPAGRSLVVPQGSGRRGGDVLSSGVMLTVRRVLREEGLREPPKPGEEP